MAEHALDNAVEHEERRLRIRLAPEHVEDRRDVGERERLLGLVHGSFPDVSSSLRSGDCPQQASQETTPDWRIVGDWWDLCNCAIGCPCVFGSDPTLGYCEGVLT